MNPKNKIKKAKKVKKMLLAGLAGVAYSGCADTWQIQPDTAQYEVTGAVKTIKQCFLNKKALKAQSNNSTVKKADKADKSNPTALFDKAAPPCDWQVINHFNRAGNLTQREFVSRGYRLDYTYQKDNDLTRIDFYDEKHIPTHVIFPVKTAVNDKGTRRTVRYPDDVLHHRYEIVPVEKASLGRLDKRDAIRREYQYDKSGRLVNTLYYSYHYDGLNPVDQRQLRYDDKGRLAFILYRTDATSAPRNLLDYDDKGELASERYVGHSASDDNATVYNNQYTKDSQGNWTVLQQFRQGELAGVTYRDIAYYEEATQAQPTQPASQRSDKTAAKITAKTIDNQGEKSQ